MGVQGRFNKPAGLKYTDMCIYIDSHLEDIKVPGAYPYIEAKIYEYLYHIIYALALKGDFFKSFADYENFAMDSAGELFVSIRKKQINAGKEVRGKVVEPIKSCLNYIKSVMLPLKANYQQQSFAKVYNADIGHNTDKIERDMRDSVQAMYRQSLESDLGVISEKLPKILWHVVRNTPYRRDNLMLHRIYISCQLTFSNDMTLSSKVAARVDKYKNINNPKEYKILQSYQNNINEVILWHLPAHMSGYIRLLVVKLKHEIGKELQDLRSATDLSEEMLDDILKSAYDYRVDTNED